MSLETTLKEIQSLKPFAEEDVESGPVNTMAGRRGRKTNAINRINTLKLQYVSELLDTAIFLVVCGNRREDFEKIATNETFNLFSTDPETFYKDLASRVHPSLYHGRTSPTDLFDVVGRHIWDKMVELGVQGYNQVVFRDQYVQSIDTPEQFEKLLKVAINEQIGAEIVGIQAVNSIANKAMAANHSTKTTPIILNTQDEKLAMDLMDALPPKHRTVLVIAGKVGKELRNVEDAILVKDVSEESVKSTLDKIKSFR